MGWVVIDTNQAIRAKPSFISSLLIDMEGFILSPFVLGELWNSNNYDKTIEALAKYPLRLAMTPGEVMYRVASLQRSQIVAFSPFYNQTPQEAQHFLLDLPAQKVQELVADTTTHIKATGDVLRSAIQAGRDYLKSQGYDPRKFKFDGFAAALQLYATGFDSVLASWIIQFVSKNGSRRVQATLQELYTGTMANPYLRHYFRTFLWYALSFYQAWAKEYDDWNITIKDNDWTDMTLSLYAAPGDIILTADTTVRKAVSAVNPDGAVKTALVNDL